MPMIQSAANSGLHPDERHTHMLRPKRNEVAHGRSVIPFNVRAKELTPLGEPNRVEATFEFRNVRNLFSDDIELFVHISILQILSERSARVNCAADSSRRWPYDPGLGPPRCTPSE